MNNWISVETLPEKEEEYLLRCYDENNQSYPYFHEVGFWDGVRFNTTFDSAKSIDFNESMIKFWMPLPAPPSLTPSKEPGK